MQVFVWHANDVVIPVYDVASNVIERHEYKADFRVF